MTFVKIVLALIACIFILFSFLGALVSANNPKRSPLKLYRLCLFTGVILLGIALCLHIFI